MLRTRFILHSSTASLHHPTLTYTNPKPLWAPWDAQLLLRFLGVLVLEALGFLAYNFSLVPIMGTLVPIMGTLALMGRRRQQTFKSLAAYQLLFYELGLALILQVRKLWLRC